MPEGVEGAAGAGELLTKKIGPLPGYAWGGIAAAFSGVVILYRRHKAAQAAAANPSGAGAAALGTVPTYPTTGDLAAAGLYSPPPYEIAGNIQGPQGETGAPGASGAPSGYRPIGPAQPMPLPMPPVQAPAPAQPPAATIAPSAPSAPAQRYVTVQRWPLPGSSLSGIAAMNGISLATVERLNPQYAGNFNLIYTGQSVRVA